MLFRYSLNDAQIVTEAFAVGPLTVFTFPVSAGISA